MLVALVLAHAPVLSQWERTGGISFPFDRYVYDLVVDDSGSVFAATGQGVLRSSDAGAVWRWTGLISRPVFDLTIDSAGTMFAGTDYGVQRSTDHGSTWSGTFEPPTSIQSVVVVSPTCILAGTYQGVYRSTDGGSSWLGTMPSISFLSFVVSRPGVVTAGTSDGIYRSTDEGASWSPLGLGGGWYHSVAADSSGRLFASSYVMYRSTDDGQTWNQLTPQSVYSFGVNDSGVIFAGAWEGIYYSFDGGNKWSRIQIRNRTVNAVAFGDSGRIYGGTEGGVYYCTLNFTKSDSSTFGLATNALLEQLDGTLLAGTIAGVYRSFDGGLSWNPSGLPGRKIRSFAKDDFGKAYAGTDSCIYRSMDWGVTWDTVQMPVRTTLALAAKDTDLVFAGENDGIYRSTDGGITWTQVFNSMLARGVVAVSGGPVVAATIAGTWTSTNNGDGWTWYNTGDSKCMTRGPTGTFYVSSEYGFFRSSNGLAWTNANSTVRAGAIAAGSSLLFASVGMEILSSPDGGSNWSSLATTPSTVRSLLLHSDTLLAGTDDGVFIISEVSSTLLELHTGTIDGDRVPANSILVLGPDDLLMSTPYSVYRSTDGAATWETNLVVGSGNTFSLARDSSGNIFAAGVAIFRSTNNGNTWEPNSVGSVYINALAVSAGHVWAASWSILYHSTDGGNSWSQSTLPTSFNTMAAGQSGMLFAGSYQGVFRTSDQGVTWEPSGPSISIASLLMNPSGELFAATQSGVQRSTDNGESWTVFTNNLSGKSVSFIGQVGPQFLLAGSSDGVFVSADRGETWLVFDGGLDEPNQVLSLSQDNSSLFLGTQTGLWKRPMAELTVTGTGTQAAHPGSFKLDQNYPNPFNPRTEIRYQLSEISRVSLKVYDVLGREVATLVSGEQSGGGHKAEWNASVASGIYFYRLEAVGKDGSLFQATKKMVLIK